MTFRDRPGIPFYKRVKGSLKFQGGEDNFFYVIEAERKGLSYAPVRASP